MLRETTKQARAAAIKQREDQIQRAYDDLMLLCEEAAKNGAGTYTSSVDTGTDSGGEEWFCVTWDDQLQNASDTTQWEHPEVGEIIKKGWQCYQDGWWCEAQRLGEAVNTCSAFTKFYRRPAHGTRRIY